MEHCPSQLSADISAATNTSECIYNYTHGGSKPPTKEETMAQIITCHNKSCRLRVPITTAKNKNGQLFCSERCANGCNPPVNDKPAEGYVNTTLAEKYWAILRRTKPRPHPNNEVPVMEFGVWD
jgi:hypothetical protein